MCYYTVIKLSVACIIRVLFFWDTGVVAQIISWFPGLKPIKGEQEDQNLTCACSPGDLPPCCHCKDFTTADH